MIRHIFKKDLGLLWPFVAGLTVLQIVIELARYRTVTLGENSLALMPFELLGIVVWVFLVLLVAHQDPLPGTRQDWLTRPIKRVDLLLAKLLFLVALLHGPTFIANTADVVAVGFSLPQALGAAAANAFAILATVTFTTFAVAAVTRTTTEFLIAAIIVGVIVEVASVLFFGITGAGCGPACDTSIEWTSTVAAPALLLTAALAVLGLQYLKRDATRSARALVAGTPVLLVALWNLPWDAAFAIQQTTTGAVEPQDRVTIELDGASRPLLAPQNASAQAMLEARASLAGNEIGKLDRRARRRAESRDPVVSLPLRVSGLRPGEVIWTDRVAFRLVNADGRVFRGAADELEIRADDGAAQSVLQTFSVPAYLFDATRDIDLRLELDYWITALEPTASLTLPAPSGEAELADAKCSTGLRRNGEAVRFACVSIGRPPSCYTAAVESRSTGARDPDVLICDPNYNPFRGDYRLFRPFAITLPLADRSAAASSVVQISAYSPRAHSTSRLVVARLRLADWAVTAQ